MTEKSFNMQSFHHSIYITKPVDEVYNYVGTGNGLTKWFIGKSVYTSKDGKQRKDAEIVQVSDEYEWRWLAKNFSTKGKVLETKENSLFKFTFGSLFIVTITLKEDRGRTLFTLKQEYAEGVNHNDFAHINCCVCWGFFITNLKSVIEFGNDLREVQIDSEDLINR